MKRSRKPKGMGRKGSEPDDMEVDTSAAAEAGKAATHADISELQVSMSSAVISLTKFCFQK